MKARHSITVGAFLIGGVVLFGVGLFMIGSENNLFAHTFPIYAWFPKMSGLTSGAQVHVSGYDAGSISDIRIPEQPGGKFRVTLRIDRKLSQLLREGSVATIESQGMVGDQYIEIDPGNTQTAACKPGCTIQSKEATSMSDLMETGKE